MARQEPWGGVVFDQKDDDLWAEVQPGVANPRIDRILSVTCLLNQDMTGLAQPFELTSWVAILDRLRAAGVLRLSLVGLESLARNVAIQLVENAHGRGMGVVALAGDCTEGLKALIGFPIQLRLQVLFNPAQASEEEITHRLEILHQLEDSGLSVTVLTTYDPTSALTLSELGEKLDRIGIQKWLIHPGYPGGHRSDRFTSSALEEVRSLSRDIPWLEVRYGSFLERELDLLICQNGRVIARESPNWPEIQGTVDQLAAGRLLPQRFLDRHVELWVSGRVDCEESFVEEDPIFDRCENTNRPEPYVFICYRHKDRRFAINLHNRLKAAGISVWIDDVKIQAGDRFHQVIERALEQSQVVVILLGPAGLGDFQKREVAVALQLESDRALKVIPVILPGVEGDAAIPPFLRTLHYIDFRRADINPFERLQSGIRHALQEIQDGGSMEETL